MAIRRSRSQAFVLRAPFLLIMCKDGKAAFGRPIALPMHARELIELAGLVSAHGPLLMEGRQQLPAECLEQYWTSSKVRLDRWTRTLREFAGQTDARRRRAQWPVARATLEEIFAAEVLTRVWTAVLCGYDRRRGSDDAEPLARSVLSGHVEARHRALLVLASGPGIDAAAAAQLNRLRRRAERWTDLLVGQLAGAFELAEFAANPERARDFAADLSGGSPRPAASPGRCCRLRCRRRSGACSLRSAPMRTSTPGSPPACSPAFPRNCSTAWACSARCGSSG